MRCTAAADWGRHRDVGRRLAAARHYQHSSVRLAWPRPFLARRSARLMRWSRWPWSARPWRPNAEATRGGSTRLAREAYCHYDARAPLSCQAACAQPMESRCHWLVSRTRNQSRASSRLIPDTAESGCTLGFAQPRGQMACQDQVSSGWVSASCRCDFPVDRRCRQAPAGRSAPCDGGTLGTR